MSLNLEAAFNVIINLKGRLMELHDLETDTKVSFKIAKSNYFRSLQGMEEISIDGREFIISKKLLVESGFPGLVKNVRIIDPEGGQYTISDIEEMEGLGNILGYRVKTS